MAIVLVLGCQGSGKTWLLAHLLRAHLADLANQKNKKRPYRWPPTFIHDERMRESGEWRTDCVGCIAPEKYRFERVAEIRSFMQKTGKAPYVSAVYGDAVEPILDLAWSRRQHGAGAVLAIDELDRLSVWWDKDSPIYRMVHHGRPYPFDIFGSARRPETINKSFISEASEIYCFHLAEKNSLATLKGCGVIGIEKAVEKIPTLKPREFIKIK